MNEQLLKDFIATAQKYNYNWNKAFGLFPELKGYDQQVLKDYVATAEKYNYDYGVVNSKFPELGFGEPSKKKELTASASNLEKPTSASSSKRRFEGVTEEPVSQKKVRTDDYIDQVQNAKTQPKQTKTVVANTFVPNVTEQNVDVITTDEANKIMAEDFGKKEFELYSQVSDIDPNVLGEGKTSAVDYLNNKFKGSGFVFEKGVVGESGNSIIIKSTLNDGFGTVVNEKIVELPTERVLSIGGFDEEGAKKAQKEIADFMNQAFLKKSEKEFLNKEVTDYGQLVKLAVNNPQKYGEEFLNQYDSERWLDEQYRDLVIEGKSIQREKQNLQSEIDAYKKSGVFNAETERLISSRQANLQNQIEANATKYTDLKDISTKLPKAAAVYFQKKEKEGNLAGLIGRQAIGGFTGIPKMIATTGVDIAPALIPSKYLIPEVQQVRLKASGMSEADIRDYAAKQVRQGVLEEGLQATKDIFSLGTTEEYVQSQDRGDLEKVASFLAESIGTAVSGGGNPLLTKLAFFSQSYNAIEDEMNSPEFDGMSQMEKKIMSVPYGLVIGALDRLGFNVATKIGSNPVVNKLITNTIANAFTSIPKNASIEVMEQAIKESLTATIAKTGLQIAGGSLVEGTTEGVQSLAEYGMKNLYNNFVADKEVFQDVPDITTKEGFDKALGAAKEEFYYGALGGAIMSTGGVALESIAKGFNKGAEEFDFFSKVIDDPNLRALIQTDIKTKITSGEITKAQAAEQIDAINKSVSILNQMPTDMSSDKKMEAYNLILEKNKIDKEIDGKDPNLVKPQTERVGEINNRLQQIAQENAVQKQSADEVPVQSGAGVGQEVAGGTPETGLKETAQKGQEEVDQYIADMGAEARIGSVVSPIMDKMANAEFINDNDIDNAITTIFNEVEQLEKSDKYSPETKAAISDKLLNIADKLDNYEFRTKTETVETTKAGTATAARKTSEAVRKIRAEKYFNGVKATVNGQEVTLQDKNGRVEAPMPNGEVIVLDTPSMEIAEDGFEFDENDALVSVTVNDRLGNTAKLTGDQALDFAIRDRENKLGVVEQADFDTIYQEVERQYVKESAPVTEEVTGEVTEEVTEEAPVVTEAAVTPEINPNEKFTFAEDKVPAALKGVEPIGRTEVGKRGLLGIRKGKPTVTLTYSGQQLIDAGINQSTIQNEEFTKTSERTEAQARPENDGRADQAVRENAKRENVKTSIQRLRDQGLLVTAKAKGGKMTDAEINAFMSLSDAMAKVWKQTTGQDNFYDTFIDQVKQGDLNAIKEKGGVLFQNIEIPQRPISRVTLAVFQLPEFRQMIGKEVSVEQVRNMIKSRGKQIEKDIINEVLSYDKYQEKKMMFDVFRNDVEIQLMKLEPITTATYATYGMDNLGKDQNYGNAETIVFNTPVDHGYTGHFGSDFSYGNLGSSTRWEIRQLPGVNQYVAIDADMPSGLVGDQIAEYVGTAGSKESVEKWVEKRKDILSDELNVGLFGHIRSWFNKGTGVFTLAEAQSDWFQKKKPADIFSSELTQEKKAEIDKIARKAAEAEVEKLADYLVELNKSASERYGLSVDLEKDITSSSSYYELLAIVKDSNGNILSKNTRTFTEELGHNKYNEQELTTDVLIRAISEIRDDTTGKYNALLLNKARESDGIIEQQLKDIDTILNFDAETNYFSSDEKGIILSDLERNMFRLEEASRNTRNLKEFQIVQENIDRLGNILKLFRPDILDLYFTYGRKVIHKDVRFINGELNTSDYDRGNELSKQRKIAENNAIEEIKNSKKGDLILQQFLASAKVHELRLMRESFKHAANKGAKELWFPTPYTLAVIEGYVDSDADGTGNAPYEIVDARYINELNQGDTINYQGDIHIVLDSDSTTITVADRDYVSIYDRDEYIHSEAYNYYGDELSRDFESQFPEGIERGEFESGAYKRNEAYANIVQDEIENWFNANPDEDVLFWDGISDDVISEIEDRLSLWSNEDLFGNYGNIYEGGYGTVYVVEGNRELELLQADQYEEAPTEKEGWEDNLADNQKTVVNKYKELNKVFEKLRPDTQLKVDDNGRTWLSTNITAEDLMNPVIAFQNEGDKVKGAVDFSNDNKASIYLFDGADISTLAHEVSGHVGRRMLAKLAETDKDFRKDYEAAMKWAGAKDGEWSVAAEEKFARGFERYLQTGKAPFEELRSVFEKLRTWLTNIYKQIRGSSIDVKLTPEITRVFDNLLRVKTKEKPMADNKMKSVMAIVKQGKEQGKTDEEIRKDAMNAGFGAKDAANALAMYYAQGEGIFTRSGKTGVTTKLVEGAKKLAQQYVTSKGLMPKIGFNLKERMEGEISKEANRAVKTSRKFGKLFDKTKEDKELLLKDFDNYIRGDKSVQLPNEFIGVANEMRNHIDTLSEMLINNGAVTGEMADTIINNLGSYLSRSYEIYDNKNFRNKVGDELVNQARNFLRTQPGTILEAKAEAIKKGIPLDQAIEGILDNEMGDLFADVKLEGFFKGSKVGAKDLSTLKFRQDIPEQIRMLMGQYSDPAMNYARTVNKLIHLAAQHKFLSDVREAGFGKFFFEKGDALRPAGYNTQIAAKGSEVMAPLNGLYTTPEIFEAFQKQFSPKEIGAVMKFFYRVMSLTKWLKTIASLGTHAKNIFGNTAFVMSNGHDITKLGSAIKIVANDLKTMSKPEIQAKIDEYIEAGIMRQGAGINEIRDMFKDASLDDYLERRLSAKQPRTLFGKAGKFLSSFGKKIVTGLEDAYQAEDDMFKIAAYENEMSRYADALYNKQVKNLTPEQKAEVSKVAAENVKNTYPTYSRIPEGIKMMRKVPLFIGSFISFQAEAYRTAFNTIALAKEELSSDNKKLKKIGATRVAGATAYLTIKTAFLSYFGMAFGTGLTGVLGYLFDDDDEKEKEKDVREFLPEWSKNSDLIITKKADGTIEYIDFSASDAHGGLNKVLNAFFRGEDLLDSFSKSLLATIEPFVGPDITVGLAIQLYNNENDFGGKVYNEQDTFAEKTRKITDYVYKVIEPGTLTSARKLMKEEDTKNVVRGELTGMKTRPLEVKKQFEFKVADYAEEFAEIKRIYNSEYNKTVRMMGDPKATKKDIEDQKKITDEAFSRANSQYDAKTKQLMELVNAANRLGVEYDELIQIIKAKKAINQYNLFEIQQGRPAIIEEKPY
jgi:hypothetical protein